MSDKKDQKLVYLDGDIEVKSSYTAADLPPDLVARLGHPGMYPFTRSARSDGYRSKEDGYDGKPWTQRQFSGLGDAEESNQRYLKLIAMGKAGETGLSVAFDMPTLNGMDSDNPMAQGEVGKCGVAIDTLADMELLFRGIDLGSISTSMTINSPATILLAMYIAAAEKQGVEKNRLRGTLQNDPLKEAVAQPTDLVSLDAAVKLTIDVVDHCTKEVPKWNTISISGYHIREAGSTAVQELAFTLADGIAYVEKGIERGINVDDFAPRLSFFFDCHNEMYVEIAKFRAARKMWANIMMDRFHTSNKMSQLLRFHTQTAGHSLTAQYPELNVGRTMMQAAAAVMGGTQSLHTNAMDETLAIPTEYAAIVAALSQQYLLHESGISKVTDPWAGSYFMEALTAEVEKRAMDYIRRIDEMGGMIRAVENGFPQREIEESSARYQREMERGERKIIGVNVYQPQEETSMNIWKMDKAAYERQLKRLHETKAGRNKGAVNSALNRLEIVLKAGENVMPVLIDACKAYATLEEMYVRFKRVHGSYNPPK